MKAEVRADGVHIDGYVNVPGRQSRPVITANHGRVVEVIEQRAFTKALQRAGNVRMLLDHDRNRVLAQTKDGTLKLNEDAIGLRAESVVTDKDVVEAAKEGKLKGWSFNMRNVEDFVEERANDLPLRYVRSFDIDEITLVLNRTPCYASTSVEVRSDEGVAQDVEYRSFEDECEVKEAQDMEKPNKEYWKRLEKLKKQNNPNG